MKLRCRSEGKILRASVALMWMGGKSVAEIAAACAISKGYVSVIATMLRAEGMDLPHRKRGIPLGSRRKPKRSAARGRPNALSPDSDDILDAWADGVQARDLALMTRRSLGSVKQVIYLARRRGNARAIPHPRWPVAA